MCVFIVKFLANKYKSLTFCFQCMGHTWYLSVDMQLFILAPFLIYLLYHYRTKIVVLIVAMIAYSTGSTLYLYIYHGFMGRWIDFKYVYKTGDLHNDFNRKITMFLL